MRKKKNDSIDQVDYSWREFFRDITDVLYHQEYILRAYLSFSTKDLNEIDDFESIHRFVEYHNDEEIQHKLDLYGSQGTDLTDTKYGTTFYREWLQKKHDEVEAKKPKVKVNLEVAQKRKEQFDKEKDRIMGARKLRPVQQNVRR